MWNISLVTETLRLCISVFFFMTGYRLTARGKPALRTVLARIAVALGAYWAIFLPRLFWLRHAGLSDIGRATILREMLTLGDSVVPFAGYVGCYIAGLLLVWLFARVPQPHPAFSVWLYVAAPVTVLGVLRYYAASPELVRAIDNLLLGVCVLGAGCAAARSGPPARVDAALMKRRPAARRCMLCATALLALAGHFLLPRVTLGSLQLAGDRIGFVLDLDMLYVPVLLYAAARLLRAPGAQAGTVRARREMAGAYFGREITDAVKGVALIMMFAHHFFTFPEWYEPGISYPEHAGFAEVFRLPLSICVPVFAFLTGYFFALRPRTLRGSLRKIADVLITYWAILLPLFALAAACGASLQPGEFAGELLALESEVMRFNWYICFYIIAMLMLPLLGRLPHGHMPAALAVFIVLPVFAATAVKACAPYGSYPAVAAQDVLDGVCSLGAGYVTAAFSLYPTGFDAVLGKRTGRRAAYLCRCALLCAAAFLGRTYAPRVIIALPWGGESWQLRVSMDMIYAPAFVYGLANLLAACPARAVMRALGEIGRYSLHMWLLSCAFFNVGKAVCQPVLYAPRLPLLVLLWGLLLCYAAARLIDVPIRALLRLQNGQRRGRA